jgi:glycosyltransferase involved in cell wall biosynthesis
MAVPVLYISYDGMTDPLGQSQVIPYLAGLSKKGYSFSLISCEKKDAYNKNGEKIHALLKDHRIDWHPISYTKKPPVLSTVYDVYRIRKLAFKLYTEKKFSIVHCRSYIAALAGLEMKRKLPLKFIFDMRGLWADERVDGKLWNLSNPLFHSVYNYFKKKEKEFLENADYTISLTHNAKEEILSWKNVDQPRVKIEVIPCCVDLQLFNKENISPEKVQALKDELKIADNNFTLLYLGSIGTWYMLEEMMEFFSILKKTKPHAKFLFVTRDEHERILQTAERFGVKESIILRPGSREEIPALISLADYSVFFILPSYSKKASSPTKQGEIMALGVPVICNTNVGDTDKIVREYKSGILVDEFSLQKYQQVIRNIELPFDASAIMNGAKDYFSLEKGVEKYAAVYRAVLS